MSKPDVILCGGYNDWDIDALEAKFTLHRADSADHAMALSGGAENARFVGYAGHHPCGEAFFKRFPKVELVANFGVGYDAIDVVAAAEHGVKVTNTPGVLTDDVADLTVLMMLSWCRQSHGAETYTRAGKWAAEGAYPLQRKMSGGKVGILGLGRIGRAIADRLAAFNMEISYYSRAPKDAPEGWRYCATPQDLAAEVDFLVIACAGGPATANICDAAAIAALGKDGVIVNISRGSTVDESAMLDALESGAIAGAALDVFASEPDFDARFVALDNVLLLPHVGSATVETRKAMGALMTANIVAASEGRALLTPVN